MTYDRPPDDPYLDESILGVTTPRGRALLAAPVVLRNPTPPARRGDVPLPKSP